jgi:hypothetical protein
MKFERSIWIFLILGIALRCVALNQPLVDAHLIRQCMTAAATKDLIEQPGFHLSSRIPWLGDLDTHYVQELPIYNFLAMGIYFVTHDVDLSGKLTSILLWAASFFVLQFIWRRILSREQTFWANFLFIVAPLGVFYGQAFMPEMLIQLLGFAFVLLALRYDENPTLGRWSLCASVGLVGSLVKLPEIAHLYLIPAFLVFRRESWKALFRPRYLIAAAATIAAIKGWSTYVDSVNAPWLPDWTSRWYLHMYIGTLEQRFHFKPWAMVFVYLGGFIVPGPAAVAAAYGFWLFLRRQRNKILGLWLISLAAFYLLWFANAGPAQSYYNLPALAPLCTLFGIGMSALLAWKGIARWRHAWTMVALALVVLSAIPIWRHLFKQDRQILAAARAIRTSTKPTDVILFRPNHRWDLIDYAANPVLAYYSERPSFAWTGNTAERYRRMALERSRYAIVTLPQPPPRGLLGALNRFRGSHLIQPEATDWLEKGGFRIVRKEEWFEVYRRD